MAKYIVNSNTDTNPRGDHEVHNVATCWTLPSEEKWVELGEHSSCHGALSVAKTIYSNSDGCIHCCEPCNTG